MAVGYAEYLLENGSTLGEIIQKGVSNEDISNINKEKRNDMIANEFTADDFRNMKEEDGTKIEFDLRILKEDGFTAKQLKKMGFKSNELKDAGYSLEEIEEAGYNVYLSKIFKKIKNITKGRKNKKRYSRKKAIIMEENPMHAVDSSSSARVNSTRRR